MSNQVLNLLSRIRDDAVEVASLDSKKQRLEDETKSIAFLVNKQHYFVDAEIIKAVSICESLKQIPQTKPWLRGMINSKGRLYSVSDLSIFSGSDQLINASRGHLLLFNNDDLQSALLVSRVLGFRYFNSKNKLSDLGSQIEHVEGLAGFISGAYMEGDTQWYHLDANKLISSEQFREVQ